MELNLTVEDLMLDDSFVRYCHDPYSSDAKKWQHLIATQQVSEQTVQEARSLVLMLAPGLNSQETAAEINKLRQMLREKELLPENEQEMIQRGAAVRRPGGLKRMLLAIASAAIVIAMIMVWSPGEKQQPLTSSTVSTTTGEQKTLELPDGSKVILNSNSTLSYDNRFGVEKRNVRLQGKAFFHVVKDAAKPFCVQTNNFKTLVLGTSFYVDGDSASNRYSVKLLEGRVRINTVNDKETVLLPGEEANWLSGKREFEKHHYDTAYLSAWLKGEIVFNKTPADEAFAMLQRWYGVEIADNRPQKNNLLINGKYEHAKLDDILKVICFSLNCQVKYEANRIVIE